MNNPNQTEQHSSTNPDKPSFTLQRKDVGLDTITELRTELPRQNVRILNVGAEGTVPCSTRAGDQVVNVGPSEDPSRPLKKGDNRPLGTYYTYSHTLREFHDLYGDINPDLVLVTCPNPDQRYGVLEEVLEASGPKTSVIVVLESESAEMRGREIEDIIEDTVDQLGQRFTQVSQADDYQTCLEEAGIHRQGVVVSRMNYADEYYYVVATHPRRN